MVDFRKHIGGQKRARPTNPLEIYETLDRAHDKGPLRPAQATVLTHWFERNASSRDVIVKLHTGQGKTLIGLLMLQSRLNEGKGPCVYLCPNNFLIEQTCEQAKQFGISTCSTDGDLPHDFLDGSSILVASAHKLFNGLTKFGLDRKSIAVGTLLMDDAHACADEIRQQCRIRIPQSEPAYAALRAMFDADLEAQGLGTHADIVNGKREAILPVPYWAWIAREADVAKILSKYTDKKYIKFVWPLLKDILSHCQCIFSGEALEIECPVSPLEAFGSYWKTDHRIFMSATITDDAFLVKGLHLSPDVISKPLTYEKETWSGEKMILVPSLVSDELQREEIVAAFAPKLPARKFGQAALVTSFFRTRDWSAAGGRVATTETVFDEVQRLKTSQYADTLVLVNRYDGIDLPDAACRILILDSRPYSENLSDLYQEQCRPESDALLMRVVRTIEQGMGRSVRGEKDYSVVVIIGPDLVKLVRDKKTRQFFSPQTNAQVEIGLDIADFAREDVHGHDKPLQVFYGLIRQCLERDDGWKDFYAEKMKAVTPRSANDKLLRLYETELLAEMHALRGDFKKAAESIQSALDAKQIVDSDKGWYLQEMARYLHREDRTRAEQLQRAAHQNNKMLIKPLSGVTIKTLVLSQARLARLMEWIRTFTSYSDLNVAVADLVADLTFGVRADKFESALQRLGMALGFECERPDKEWKEGPDNLWAVTDQQYILWECKDEVDVLRTDIAKSEAEQMISSKAWFETNYPGAKVRCLLVHPAHTGSPAAPFLFEVGAVRVSELKKLTRAVVAFFRALKDYDLQDLAEEKVQLLLAHHKLSVEDLLNNYSKPIRPA